MWLKIMPDGDAVRLLWGNDYGPHERSYHIGPATLNMTCQRVRESLEAMVRSYGNKEATDRAIRAVARHGAELHFVLFDASTEEDRSATKVIRAWIAEQYADPINDHKLRITGHPAIHVPWGLVFEDSTSTVEGENFAGFWGLKYELSSTLSGYSQPRAKLQRTKERRLLSMINQSVFEGLTDDLRARLESLMSHPVGVARDVDSCIKLIEQAVSFDTILHFFGHQCDGVLDLGDDQTIGIVKFKMMLDRLTEQKGNAQSYSLVMLNACESATGLMDYSFTNATERPGLCGVIGTEAVVPRDFAALFAFRFLVLMLDGGISVGEAISTLRRDSDLWPLSLVYGCYAQPDYCFKPETTVAA